VPNDAASIGSVYVDVLPRTDGFSSRVQSALGPQAARIGEQLGTLIGRPMTDRIAAAIADGITRGARDATGAAVKAGDHVGKAFADGFRGRLEAGLKNLPAAKIDADTSEATRKVDQLKANIDSLDKRVNVRVNTTGSTTTRGASAGGTTNPLATIGGVNVLNTLQGAGIVAGVGSITPITGAVLGLGSAFATTGAAAAAFGVTAAFQMKSIADAMKLVNDQGVQLADLPADFQRIIPAVTAFQGSWRQFLADTRAPIFDVFAKGLSLAQAGLVQFAPVVNAASAGMSRALDVVGQFTGGSAVANFLTVVRQQASGAIESLARSAANLGTGLLNIFTGFAPAGTAMLHIVEQITARFATWSASLAGSQAFQQFVSYAVTYGPQVVTTVANIAVAVGKLVVGVGPLAGLFIQALGAASRLLAAIPPQAWLAIAVAVGGVFLAIRGYSIVTAAIGAFQTLRTVLGTVTVIMGYATGGAVALRVALIALTAATVVGLVITGIVAGLSALASHSSSAGAATRGLTADQQALADAFKASNGAIDDQVKKTAVGTLSSKGLLAAGQSVGVDPQHVLSAYLAGGQQWTDFMDKLRTREADAWNKFYDAQVAGKPSGALKAQAQAAGDSRKAAEELTGSSEKVAASNKLEAQALGQSGGAALQAASSFDAYTRAKQAALGVGTDRGEVAADVTSSYNALQQAVRGVADARYGEAQAAKSATDANQQAARQVKDAVASEVQAARQIKEALYSEAQARRATQQAVQSLSQAREDAARKLRDQADSELSARIALEKAQQAAHGLGLYAGPVVDDATIQKQQVTLDLTSAEHAYADAQQQSRLLAQQGIEGQPAVVAARQAVTDALHAEAQAHQGVVDAQSSEAKARQAVTDAYRAQSDTFAQGAHARAAAHRATLDAVAAENSARAAWDASTAALDQTSGAAGVAKDKVSALRDELSKSLAMDTGNAQAQLADVMKYLTAIKLLAADPNMTWDQAWALAGQAPRPAPNAGAAQANRVHKATDFSSGGWTGPGGKYQPAGIVHADEFVIPKETVGRYGVGHFNQYLPGYAAGGPVLPNSGIVPGLEATQHGLMQKALSVLGFAGAGLVGTVSGIVAQVQSWLKNVVDPLPYVFGATGPNSFDCSGLVGDVYSALTGHPRNRRWFVTGEDERQFLTGHGFKPGTGTFTVGFSGEHTAGNLAGLGFEAANHIAGIHVGPSAIPVTSFPNVYYLPTLGNQFVGSSGQIINLPGMLGFQGGPFIEPGAPTAPRSGGGNAGRPVTGLDRSIAALSKLVRTGTFDSGGSLPPGLTLAYNGTGRNEYVLTDDQLRGASGTGGGVTVNVYPQPDHSPAEIAAMVQHELAWQMR